MKFEKIGQPVRRLEDGRLLTGRGRFSDDWSLKNQAYMAVVRSPHAHARIRSVDTSDAENLPGVMAIFTGQDCIADELSPIPHSPEPSTKYDMKLHGPGGSDVFIGNHMLLPVDKARYVGEGLAVVVAETLAQAQEGADAVFIDFDPLPSVTDTKLSAEVGAPEEVGVDDVANRREDGLRRPLDRADDEDRARRADARHEEERDRLLREREGEHEARRDAVDDVARHDPCDHRREGEDGVHRRHNLRRRRGRAAARGVCRDVERHDALVAEAVRDYGTQVEPEGCTRERDAERAEAHRPKRWRADRLGARPLGLVQLLGGRLGGAVVLHERRAPEAVGQHAVALGCLAEEGPAERRHSKRGDRAEHKVGLPPADGGEAVLQ